MPATQPSGTISFSQIKSALGLTANNLGAYLGQNQTLPSAGSISFSQAQKIVKGVSFSLTPYAPITNTVQGNWSDTGITNNSVLTLTFWISIGATNSSWRSVVHVTTSIDAYRRPSVWITPNATSLQVTNDTTYATNEALTTVDVNNYGIAPTHVAIVHSNTNRKVYFNGVLKSNVNMVGTALNNTGTVYVYSGSPYNVSTGCSVSLMKFWPISMTQVQVSAAYSAEAGQSATEFMHFYCQDTSFDGLGPSYYPGFAYNQSDKFTEYMLKYLYFKVDGSADLYVVARYPAAWFGKDVIVYGPSALNFQSYSPHSWTFHN